MYAIIRVRMETLREHFMQQRNALTMESTESGEALTEAIDDLTAEITDYDVGQAVRLDAFRAGTMGDMERVS